MAEIKIGKLEGAPDWYNTPLDQLHWDWTKEEEKELERYCEKILQNSEEEEMTPMQRFEATWEGKERDRLPIEVSVQVPFATRSLDSWADTLHPADLYRHPKLHVKAWLATAARFKLDIIYVYVITFTETLWGGNAKLGEYAAPQMVGELARSQSRPWKTLMMWKFPIPICTPCIPVTYGPSESCGGLWTSMASAR